MKRREGESFEGYKLRRKADNNSLDERKVRILRPRAKRPAPFYRRIPNNPAYGKRKAGETLQSFQERRKAINARKRARRKGGTATSIVPLPKYITAEHGSPIYEILEEGMIVVEHDPDTPTLGDLA